MCLDARKNLTKATIKLFGKNHGKLTFYKMLVAYLDEKGALHLRSPYSKGKGFEWKAGWNKSSANDGLVDVWDGRAINEGFHVFFAASTYTRYKSDARSFARNQKVVGVKVIGYKKHFIASGTFGWWPTRRSAALSKLFVPKAEIDRIKKLLKGK